MRKRTDRGQHEDDRVLENMPSKRQERPNDQKRARCKACWLVRESKPQESFYVEMGQADDAF